MRTLNRPMFRTGGSTGTGITSGLAPRQGYENGKDVWESTPRELRDRPIGELYEAAGRFKPKSSGDLSKFLIDFGLNIASAEPSGSILSTAAKEAKEPFARYQKTKAERGAMSAESQSDLFGQLFKGAISGDDKTYAHRDKAAMVRENMDKQYGIHDQINALDPKAENYETQKQKLTEDLRTLKEQISSDEFAKAQLKYWSDDRNSRKLDEMIKNEVAAEMGIDPGVDFAENSEFFNSFSKRRAQIMNDIRLGIPPSFASGGRVGYQAAGSVMGDAIQSTPAMPEELGDISYEELRARLPQEVGDEIVRLLANSAEALEDFATIQTEQDIANFNKKYGVNLVLPAED